MDGEDAYGVVVRLGRDRLDHAGPLVGLLLHPLDEPAQAPRAPVVVGPGLVEEEADAAPVVARPAAVDGELEHAPLAHDRLDDLAHAAPPALLPQLTQRTE